MLVKFNQLVKSGKGQGSVIDFIVGFLLFLTVFLVNFYVWNNIEVKIANNEVNHYFESSVRRGAESLIYSGGYPVDWFSNLNSVVSVGLASSSNILSNDKLSSLSDNFDLLKDYVLSTGDFQIIISNESGVVYQVGLEPHGKIIRVDRLVMINDSYYLFTFKGWRVNE